MLKRTTLTFFVIMMFATLSVSTSHAATITLDGVANAVLWSEDKTRAYLNVWDESTSSYYYQWQYDGVTSLQWNNIDELVTDLNSQGIAYRLESGGDPFNSPSNAIWKSIYLSEGIYDISLADSSEAYNLIDYWGGDEWNAYVQIWTGYGDSFSFGSGTTSFISENNALSYYNTYYDGMVVNLHQDTEMYFYINDWNSIDNSGSVTLDIEAAPVPEPSTIVMLASGLLLLIAFRYKCSSKKSFTQAV